MRARFFGLTAVTFIAGTWIACVGDDPKAVGEAGGSCNQGQCLNSLVCINNVCQDVGAAGDGGGVLGVDGSAVNDGGTPFNDANANADADADTTCGTTPGREGTELGCPNAPDKTCPTPTVCCKMSVCANGTTVQCGGVDSNKHPCETASQCPFKASCCHREKIVSSVPLTMCPLKAAGFEGTHCQMGGCSTEESELCRTNDSDACKQNERCQRLELDADAGILDLGMCVPK